MTVFQTEIHIVTFIFIVLESLLFSHQLIFYLQKPAEKQRKYYLILLFLLIIYNIAGGLFPDESLPLSIRLQYILAYGTGFSMGAYFPYYFYQAFNLTPIAFHAKYGVLMFLIAPFVIFFCILYPMGVELRTVIYVGLTVPLLYAFYLMYKIFWAIRIRYKNRTTSVDAVLSYLAVCPWTLMPPMAYLEVEQLTEVLLTNGGFIIVTVLFIRKMIGESRKEFEILDLIQTKNNEEIFYIQCTKIGLTKREVEVCELVRNGRTYKEIGEALFISERTVNKHIQNIFKKANTKNKVELLNTISGK